MNKHQVFYIHGGSPYVSYDDYLADLQDAPIRDLPDAAEKIRWSQSLRADLGNSYEVFMPLMPNKQNAQYDEWKIWFERHFEYLHDGIILVGISLGAMFLAKYLSEHTLPFTVKHLFLLAGPYEDHVNLEINRQRGGSFAFDGAVLKNMTIHPKHITIMHSKDDFVVPYEHALQYKAALPEAELVTFEDKNHFLVEELPELIERIRELT